MQRWLFTTTALKKCRPLWCCHGNTLALMTASAHIFLVIICSHNGIQLRLQCSSTWNKWWGYAFLHSFNISFNLEAVNYLFTYDNYLTASVFTCKSCHSVSLCVKNCKHVCIHVSTCVVVAWCYVPVPHQWWSFSWPSPLSFSLSLSLLHSLSLLLSLYLYSHVDLVI